MIIAIIPSRYNSTRLPGKPLLKFGNDTMIQKVYKQVKKSKLINELYVTTDNDLVQKSVEDINGNVIRVDKECLNGTERICYAINNLKLNENDIIVNVQGDEPFINPVHIDICINNYLNNINRNNFVCSTLHYILNNNKDILSPNIGKLVLNNKNDIMYCSRNIIPSNKKLEINSKINYYGHIGVFVFKKSYLNEYIKNDTEYQLEEDIEWLKIIENGFIINSICVENVENGVNVKEDYDFLLNKYKLL